jgi:hypothetical protein
MVIAASGRAFRVVADDLPVQGRATQGRRILKDIGEGDVVVEVARVVQEREDDDDGGAAQNGRADAPAESDASGRIREQLDLME